MERKRESKDGKEKEKERERKKERKKLDLEVLSLILVKIIFFGRKVNEKIFFSFDFLLSHFQFLSSLFLCLKRE